MAKDNFHLSLMIKFVESNDSNSCDLCIAKNGGELCGVLPPCSKRKRYDKKEGHFEIDNDKIE